MNEDQVISRKYSSKLRDERAAETRLAILTAARRLFATHGYAHTTLADLAATAGVSTQTIYNSVGGKPEVVFALVEIVDEIAAVTEALHGIDASEDPQEIVQLVVAMRRRAVEQCGDILQVFVAAAASEPVVARAREERAARSRALCRQIVERLHGIGGLRSDLEIDEAADALYTLLHHVLWHRLATECGWDLDAIEVWLVDTVRRTLTVAV